MIIIRTPMNCSFCGGGTDLPAFYKKHGGAVISTSINRYVYISINPYFYRNKSVCKYSEFELVNDPSEISHPILRILLNQFELYGVEITGTSDIPESSGLGTDSSFTVGLINALHKYCGNTVSPDILASEACHIEIGELCEPIGKHDQYAAAFGGFNLYSFKQNGDVHVDPVQLQPEYKSLLEGNLLMFYTGSRYEPPKKTKKTARNAVKTKKPAQSSFLDDDMEKTLLLIRDMTFELHKELLNGNIDSVGHFLHAVWEQKRKPVSGISNQVIDKAYEIALASGAKGGKLLGTGDNGFLLLYAPKCKHTDIKNALCRLRHIPFGFSDSGSTVIYSYDD